MSDVRLPSEFTLMLPNRGTVVDKAMVYWVVDDHCEDGFSRMVGYLTRSESGRFILRVLPGKTSHMLSDEDHARIAARILGAEL